PAARRFRYAHRPPTRARAAHSAARPRAAPGARGTQRRAPASQREDRRARGLASFQVAVCLLHLLQRVALVDADLDLAAGDGLEQVIGHLLAGLARGDVREERLARHVERTLGAQ